MKTWAPLQGIQVVDLTRVLSGPLCTQNLGDLGATIVKIEECTKGDESRQFGPPFVANESAYFIALNRNKKSIAIDLKSQQGKNILSKLISKSQVLVENFSSGTLTKLGFSYEDCIKINPTLIYVSINGYGTSKTKKPAYDLIIQGETGMMNLTGGSTPTKVGVSLSDISAGHYATHAILAALQEKNTPHCITIPMIYSQFNTQLTQVCAALNTSQEPQFRSNRHQYIAPFGTISTADGQMNLCIGNERLWSIFTALDVDSRLLLPQFSSNTLRVQNTDELYTILDTIFSQKSTKQWIELLEPHNIPCGEILSLTAALDKHLTPTSIHNISLGNVQLKVLKNPITVRHHALEDPSAPPHLGANTISILEGLGYDSTTITEYLQQKIIYSP